MYAYVMSMVWLKFEYKEMIIFGFTPFLLVG